MNEEQVSTNAQTDAVSADSDAFLPEKGTGKKKKFSFKKIDLKNKKTKKIIKRTVIIVIIAALAVGGWLWFKNASANAKKAAQTQPSTSVATRGELKVTITGNGVMEAMDQYDIVPMVKGSITSAPFEEGDIVEKDALLYTFDNSDAQINIQKAQNSIAKAAISQKSDKETLADWKSTAPVDGHISGLDLKVGDSVSANTKVCTITNDDVIKVDIPFSAASTDNIYIGSTAQLTSADYMTSGIYGTVSDIDYSPIRSNDGGVMYYVEITLDNPGAITEGMKFTASVNGYLCAASGTSKASDSETVSTKASGKVVAVYHKNGDKVSAGDKIIEISNDSTLDSISKSGIEYSDLQLSLQSQYDALDDYTVKSPIAGTVIKKDYKAGDTVGTGTNSTVLATIADMSKMKFTMSVDELDISKIQVGQSVDIVADALENEVFAGTITQIIQEGESQSGVTTYPVEVVIDAPGSLMIGMNVTATVVVESKQDILKVPIDAVSKTGGKSYVQVLKADAKAKSGSSNAQMPNGAQSGNGSMTHPSGTMPQNGAANGGSAQTRTKDSGSAKRSASGANTAAATTYTMDDFERVEVTVGINNEDEIEIVSGINEGDIVYITTSTGTTTNTNMMPGGMGGMGGMGGAPGGMGGAMGGGTSNRSGASNRTGTSATGR